VTACWSYCREGCAVVVVQIIVLVAISTLLIMIGIIVETALWAILGTLLLLVAFFLAATRNRVG
jgi:hypothetical protein